MKQLFFTLFLLLSLSLQAQQTGFQVSLNDSILHTVPLPGFGTSLNDQALHFDFPDLQATDEIRVKYFSRMPYPRNEFLILKDASGLNVLAESQRSHEVGQEVQPIVLKGETLLQLKSETSKVFQLLFREDKGLIRGEILLIEIAL